MRANRTYRKSNIKEQKKKRLLFSPSNVTPKEKAQLETDGLNYTKVV